MGWSQFLCLQGFVGHSNKKLAACEFVCRVLAEPTMMVLIAVDHDLLKPFDTLRYSGRRIRAIFFQ